MNIVEHDDNIVTKELSQIERYLLRIIQRYFDMYNTDNRNSIEAIVVESLTRMKRDILHEKSFVFSVNGKAGHITLTASDIGAEPVFSKNTAFNKDFAPAGKNRADTICEGNDPRLSNSRDPNFHNHDRYDNFIDEHGIPIYDINNNFLHRIPAGSTLNDLLEQCNVITSNADHAHVNFTSVLQRLRYSGSRTEIDLAYLEITKKNISEKIDIINGLCEGFSKRVQTAMSGLEIAERKRQEYYDWAMSFSKDPPSWYDSAIQYTNTMITNFKNHCNDCINASVSPEDLDNFIDETLKYLHCFSGYLDISNIQKEVKIEDGICETSSKIEIPTYDTDGKIQRVDAYLEYEYDGCKINIPIPFATKELDNFRIVAQLIYTETKAYVEFKVVGKVPYSVQDNSVYNDNVVIYKRNSYIEKPPRNTHLCIIDSQEKLNFVNAFTGLQKDYYINAFCNFLFASDYSVIGFEWTYECNGNKSPMTFFCWDPTEDYHINGYPDDYERVGYLNQQGNMQSTYFRGATVDETKGFLYEFVAPFISTYYTNPRIHYKIYVGEGDSNGINS